MSHLQDHRVVGINLSSDEDNQYVVEQEIQLDEYPEYEDEDDDEGIENLNIDEVEKVDNNLIVDEEFQHSLNERFNELSMKDNNTNSLLFISRPKINYDYNETFPFQDELNEWFTSEEIDRLHVYQTTFFNEFQMVFDEQDHDRKLDVLASLKDQLTNGQPNPQLKTLKCLLYLSLGAFDGPLLKEADLRNIQTNVDIIIDSDLIVPLIWQMKESFNHLSSSNENLVYHSTVIYLISTILYVCILSKLTLSDGEDGDIGFSAQLDSTSLLHFLTKCIDSWRWNAKASVRIRNIIILFTKAFQYIIGDLDHRRLVKGYLCQKFNIKKVDDENKLTNSPIEYHLFRQELLARYPTYIPPPSKLPSDFENSSSLLQFITIPKNLPSTLHKHHIPPAPPLAMHIATPAPSPPLSPQITGNRGIKGKRSFQTNPNYPLIFPVENNDANEVPDSIKEATSLFQSRIVEKLGLKQLWNERDYFIKQEKGWSDTLDYQDDLFQYFHEVDEPNQKYINSLNRIEEYYHDSSPQFSSLVHVFLQILINSKDDALYIESPLKGLSPRQIDILAAKQILVKNVSYALRLLLQWLKVSHILKFEYLSSLIYDSNYIELILQQFKDADITARINRSSIIQYKKSMWVPSETKHEAKPSSSSSSSSQSKSKSPPLTSSSSKAIDTNFCFTYVNLITVLTAITLKKSQRLLRITEKDPSEIFHNLLSGYNKHLWNPILKLIKALIPISGKKWKSNNMDLISLVYLHMRLNLSDNWLTTRDIEREANDAYGQEIAMRALVQFYNMRKYKDSMSELGYQRKDNDFFSKEVDIGN